VVDVGIDVGLLATNGDDDELLRMMATSMVVVVARRLGQRRREIARQELAVPADLCGAIRRRGHVNSAEFGCGERGRGYLWAR
jgi:hypothetical protein